MKAVDEMRSQWIAFIIMVGKGLGKNKIHLPDLDRAIGHIVI